jgi:cell division protein FtsW (lipid II flippase)
MRKLNIKRLLMMVGIIVSLVLLYIISYKIMSFLLKDTPNVYNWQIIVLAIGGTIISILLIRIVYEIVKSTINWLFPKN